MGEDAMTIKLVRDHQRQETSRVTTTADKFFQVNAALTLNVSNRIVHRAGKALRRKRRHDVPGST